VSQPLRPLIAALAGALALAAPFGCGGSDDAPTSPEAGDESISFESGPPGDHATLYAVGDGADGSARSARVVGLINQAEMDRFLYLGDVYEVGSPAEFDQNYEPLYGAFKDRTSPTPGNHDWPAHRRGYDPYWDPPGERSTPPYYAFEMAGWELISLNSEIDHGPASPQVKWLHERLGESGTCRIAFWHAPRYSAGVHHGDDPSVQPFWDALAGHAVLVLNGHEHNYQRFHPVSGIVELIAGAGGHEAYGVIETDPRLVDSSDTTYGLLRIELAPGRAHFSALRVGGAEPVDSGSVSCRPLGG
jgi:calcineurin-like phosphoesterase family protein